MRRFLEVGLVCALVFSSSCAYLEYPGQPGMVTNGYSKIDYEYLDYDGLWVYEVAYDNREGGAGVGALISKFYPGATTYTSNARFNSEATLYKAKGQYDGAEVQSIVIPSLNQIIMPPNNNVWAFMVSYSSENEVDDRNLAEEGIFKPLKKAVKTDSILERASRFMQVAKAGKLNREGNLSYFVSAIELDGKKLELATPVHVQTNIFQNAVRSNLSVENKQAFVKFIEANFPKGFGGDIKIHMQDATEPLVFKAAVHTLGTAKNVGYKVIERPSVELKRMAEKYSQRS